MNEPAASDVDSLADRVLGAYERDRTRRIRLTLQAAFLILVPIIVFTVWLVVVGYNRHALELTVNDRSVRLVSHRAKFEVYTHSDEVPRAASGGFLFERVDRIQGTQIQPRAYGFDDWTLISISEQQVRLPDRTTSCQFFVNAIPFTLTPRELSSGPKRWLLPPDGVKEIDLDQLDSLVPQAGTAPAARQPSR